MDNLNLLYCDTFDRFVSCFDSDFSKLDRGFISLMDILTRKRLNNYEQTIKDEILEKGLFFVERVREFDRRRFMRESIDLLEIVRIYHNKKMRSNAFKIDYRNKRSGFMHLYIDAKLAQERIDLFPFLDRNDLKQEYDKIDRYERRKFY